MNIRSGTKENTSAVATVCPYCNTYHCRKHGFYTRKGFHGSCAIVIPMPVQRYRCLNKECSHRTFSVLPPMVMRYCRFFWPCLLRRFGIPKRLYTDNGAAFRSRHLRMVAARLGVSLPHTPPYMPRGRGKIERFFRSLREGFLNGRERTSLEKLNADLAVWVNQYHHSTHSALGISPLERKLADKGPQLKQIAATQDIDEIFCMEHNARVASDGCVRMFKKRFEIPHAIPGSTVIIQYLPWSQDCIFVGPQREAIKPLDSINNALRYDKPRRGKTAAFDKENL